LTSLEETCSNLKKEVGVLADSSRSNTDISTGFKERLDGVCETAQQNTRSLEEQSVKFKGIFDPLRDLMETRFAELWQDSSELRKALGQQERNASDEASSVRQACQNRCKELRTALEDLSRRLDREVVQVADHASRTEALKRRLCEEAAAAVDARCAELGNFAEKLRNTVLTEVQASFKASGLTEADLAARVTELSAALESARSESISQVEQLKTALSAADRMASAAQVEASEGLRRSKHTESLLKAFLGHETVLAAATVKPPSTSTTMAGGKLNGAGGSGAGAARQLRAVGTPRGPESG
jgi:hypothetical protein